MADGSAIAKVLDAAQSDELLTPCWPTFAEARALDLPSITRRCWTRSKRVSPTARMHPVPSPSCASSVARAAWTTSEYDAAVLIAVAPLLRFPFLPLKTGA